jgi:hypothetical protein
VNIYYDCTTQLKDFQHRYGQMMRYQIKKSGVVVTRDSNSGQAQRGNKAASTQTIF